MTTRTLVVQCWSGPRTVARLRPIDDLTDADVLGQLRALSVGTIPPTAPERRARLAAYPTQADLDAVATAWTAANDGIRPTVRVLEEMPLTRRRASAGRVI